MGASSPSISPAEGKGTVLVVEDDGGMRQLLADDLGQRGWSVRTAANAADGLRLARDPGQGVDVVVSDLNLGPKGDGVELVRALAVDRPEVPVVIVTSFGSIEAAVAAIRAGAYDFITKPFDHESLALLLRRALYHNALKRELARLRKALDAAEGYGAMLGESAPMRELYRVMERVAPTETTVLIEGESGTGKELVARALHGRSARATGPFVAVNCGALPGALLESELFGHRKGAFTDARADRAGLFLAADGGTLFLDEVGELPLELQPKLLRALEQRTVRPVGGEREVAFDARLVAATNRDLQAQVKAGRFREDLYYRLNVVTLDVPPLRLRGDDVLLLAQRFLETTAPGAATRPKGFSADARARLTAWAWPGNVRELKNCVERAATLATGELIETADLAPQVRAFTSTAAPPPLEPGDLVLPLAEVERRHILSTLKHTGGNKMRTAELLGLDRSTLYRRLKDFGVDG